jgi:hypothetical protein
VLIPSDVAASETLYPCSLTKAIGLEFEIPALGEFTTLTLETTVKHRHNTKDLIYLKLKLLNLTSFEYDAISDFLDYKQRLIDMGKKQHID